MRSTNEIRNFTREEPNLAHSEGEDPERSGVDLAPQSDPFVATGQL